MDRTALVAGATGLVGSFLVKMLLEDEHYARVRILVRNPVDLVHPKLDQVLFDFEQSDHTKIVADDVYCCLGTTIKNAGSKEAFRKVDYDYPLAIARPARANGALRFGLVSAMGADAGSRFFYNQVKGELEEELRQIPFDTLAILRPSLLLGPRKEYRAGEEVGKIIARGLSFLFPRNYKGIHASQVAACLINQVKVAPAGIHVVLSGQMHNWPVKKRP